MFGKRFAVGLVIGLVAVFAVLLSRQSHWNASYRVPSYRLAGEPSASVVMMEFSDYQCPSCAQAQSIVKDLLGRHKSRLKVAFRHYPLQTHRWARLAALAAETAGVQGKFWEFSEKLFETQKEWGASDNARPHFIRFAQELGLDMERFERELDSARWDGLIQQDLIEGVARQVSSTPTFFIGERRLVGGSQLQANADRLIELLEMP